MLFTSLTFIFFFLPAILIVYYSFPKAAKNLILLLFSLIFYAWGGVSYSIILILSVIINFLFVKQIEKSQLNKKRWLFIGLTFNITTLFIFKYLDFFIGNFNELSSLFNLPIAEFSETNIVLPLGISFFTFQEMSLLWDVYRNPNTKTENFLNTALYVSFFPQLIAGPIVRYNDIIHQIKFRKETAELVSSGIRKFILGLFKKVILANTCGELADLIMNSSTSELSTPLAWLGIIAYAFQIYFDFSGYSDMAIGLGRMFGFRILENFNFPYISTSIKEFWRRWHISLSSWFKDYVYIPLGGNRNGQFNTYFNLMIVFLLTGFWHGATWSFVFWGIFHGLFLIIERLGFGKILQRIPTVFSWIYTMLVVLIGWVYFRIENFGEATDYVIKLFGGGPLSDVNYLHFLNIERIIVLALAILASSTFFLRIKNGMIRFSQNQLLLPICIVRDFIFISMLLYSIIFINSGSYNPFIYFRF